MKIAKRTARLRRARRARMRIRERELPRLSVFRSPRHIYAQIFNAAGGRVLVSASTTERELRQAATGNVEAARRVGVLIAERARNAGIEKVAFDRGGFKYHGRIAALAEAARGGGLHF